MKISNILVIDRGEFSKSVFNSPFFNDFNIRNFSNSSSLNDNELLSYDLTCIFVYEAADLVHVIPFYNRNTSLIILYSDPLLVFDNLEYAYTIDLSEGLEESTKELELIIDHILIQEI